MEEPEKCRICDSATELRWPSNLEEDLSSESFAITDAHYGKTSSIYKCTTCGFQQCSDLPEVLSFYEALEDTAYEQGRKERLLQSAALIDDLKKYKTNGKLLDVGAGSGILVEAAIQSGFEAQGVEPSLWLQQQAAKLNLPVQRGVMSDLQSDGRFDAVALIDVIEHVVDPLSLLKEIKQRLSPEGVAMVVTPDCSSFFAKILGRKWWHYRVAHIGYFNKKTLEKACEKSGLEVVSIKRPGWFFTMDYLWVRLLKYFPKWMRIKPMNWMSRITLPINLRDSLLLILKHPETTTDGSS